ncbi:hypothetical protein [Actinocorallia populi]|uniref:hypothetical protein n=1 Tax=Actinocorallia populi TaxID=2079200 RepID=UPI000D094DD4|nr:hypothetical protein [Actinocorallia populi]
MGRSEEELEELARRLHAALASAGVDTGPAMEISRIARWAHEAGTDLRRRHRLVRDLDAQRPGFSVSVPDGVFVLLPDRYSDQQARVSGYQAADLFERAAAGDKGALRSLRNYEQYSGNPYFAAGLLARLGAVGVLNVPFGLARLLHVDGERGDTMAKADAADARTAVELLGRALADGTRPLSAGYAGDDFLTALTAAGRSGFPPGNNNPHYFGYQGLGTILGSAGEGVKYSDAFIQVVGRDMLSYARRHDDSTWRAVPDAAGIPSPESSEHYLRGLLLAAGASRQGAQLLLDHTPPGEKSSNLHYLLHDRRRVWAGTDHGTALGAALRAAASGGDDRSGKVFDEIVRVLGADQLKLLKYEAGGLKITDRAAFDELSGLRAAMGDILVGRLDHVATRLYAAEDSGHIARGSREETRLLLAVIADTVTDDAAYTALFKAHVGHLRLWIDDRRRRGHAGEIGLAMGAGSVGRLLALRTETMKALRIQEDKVNASFRTKIDFGLGLVDPTAYLARFGVPAEITGPAGAKVFDEIGRYLVERFGERAEKANTEGHRISDEDRMRDLVNQMLLSSTVAHLRYEQDDVEGWPFAKDGKILPPLSWDRAQAESFYWWCKERDVPFPEAGGTVNEAIERSHDRAVRSFAGAGGER